MKAVQLSYSKSKLQDVLRQLYREHGWQIPRGLIERGQSDPRNFTLDQWQQARRTKRQAGDLPAMQDCWAVSDNRASFEAELLDHGFKLAKGDRRCVVAVSYDGEALSVARYAMAREMTPVMQDYLDAAETRAQSRMEKFLAHKAKMTARHRAERADLQNRQDDRAKAGALERALRLRSGLFGLWDRVTGKRAKILKDNEGQRP